MAGSCCRCPVHTRFFLKYTSHAYSSYSTLHPASYNMLIEMRLECTSPGTICTSRACVGNHVMSSRHVCVDCMVPPSGSLIVSGFCVGVTLVTGAPGVVGNAQSLLRLQCRNRWQFGLLGRLFSWHSMLCASLASFATLG